MILPNNITAARGELESFGKIYTIKILIVQSYKSPGPSRKTTTWIQSFVEVYLLAYFKEEQKNI